MGVKEITFSGGEPLLWRPLIKAINNCQELGIKVSIYTTGIPIIEDQNLKKRLKITQSDKIITSLYGANEESHENITRINGSFKKTIKAIKEFINCGVPVGIHFVAMKPNWEQLKEVVRLADQLGIFAVSVLRFVPHGRGTIVNHYNLSKHELRQLRKMIIYLRGNSKTYIRLGSPFNILLLNQNTYCNAACDRLIIGPNGHVYPCDAFKNIEMEGILGSIIENSLVDVWQNSSYLTKIRELIKQGLGPECSKCKSCSLCKGGCMAQKFIRLSGNVSKPDPDCIIKD